MRTPLALAVLAGALTVGAPTAHAAPLDYECRVVGIAQRSVTGSRNNFQAVLAGYIVSDTALEQVSIRCYVQVNGVPQSPDAFGANRQATVAFGVTPFIADETDSVEICADWTAGTASGTTCSQVDSAQVPPQEVIDLVESVFGVVHTVGHLLDGALCPILVTWATTNIPGILYIDYEGDVFLFGTAVWDCPPYDEDESVPLLRDESVRVIFGTAT